MFNYREKGGDIGGLSRANYWIHGNRVSQAAYSKSITFAAALQVLGHYIAIYSQFASYSSQCSVQ